MTTDSGNVKICRATHTNKFCIYFCFLLQCLTRSVPEETPPVQAPPGRGSPCDRGRGAWQIKTLWVPGHLPASRNPLNHHAALQAYSLNKTGVPDICEVPTIIFATSYFKFVGNCVKEFAPSSIQSSRLSQPLGPWRLRGFLRGAQTLRLFLQLPTRMFLLYFRSLAPTNHQCVKIVQSIAQCSEKSDQCLVQIE